VRCSLYILRRVQSVSTIEGYCCTDCAIEIVQGASCVVVYQLRMNNLQTPKVYFLCWRSRNKILAYLNIVLQERAAADLNGVTEAHVLYSQSALNFEVRQWSLVEVLLVCGHVFYQKEL